MVPKKEKLYEAAIQTIQKRTRIPHRKDQVENEDEELCCRFLDHKMYHITLDVLKKHGIKYFLIEQIPGDVVYVKPAVFHQVINIEANFAEAINFGSDDWNSGSEMSSTFKCALSRVQPIQRNRQFVNVTESIVVRMHDCPDYLFQTTRKNALGEHMKKKHNNPTPFVCNHCKKAYSYSCGLTNHNCSATEKSNKFFCKLCNIKICNFPRHERPKRHEKNAAINSAGPSPSVLNHQTPEGIHSNLKIA